MCGDRRVFRFSGELSLEAQRVTSTSHLLASREVTYSGLYSCLPFNQTSEVELPALSTMLWMVHGRLRCCFLETYLYK